MTSDPLIEVITTHSIWIRINLDYGLAKVHPVMPIVLQGFMYVTSLPKVLLKVKANILIVQSHDHSHLKTFTIPAEYTHVIKYNYIQNLILPSRINVKHFKITN